MDYEKKYLKYKKKYLALKRQLEGAGLFGKLIRKASSVASAASSAASSVASAVKNTASAAASSVKNAASATASAVKNTASAAAASVQNAASATASAVKNTASAAASSVKKAASATSTALKTAVGAKIGKNSDVLYKGNRAKVLSVNKINSNTNTFNILVKTKPPQSVNNVPESELVNDNTFAEVASVFKRPSSPNSAVLKALLSSETV